MFSRLLLQIVAWSALVALLPLPLSGAGRSRLLLDSPTLPASEKFVLAQILAGQSADFTNQFTGQTNGILRAAFLEAVLTRSGTNVLGSGVSIKHAVIPDALDLRGFEGVEAGNDALRESLAADGGIGICHCGVRIRKAAG